MSSNEILVTIESTITIPGVDNIIPGVDNMDYPQLPTDGISSLKPDDSTGATTNSPENFNGNTGTSSTGQSNSISGSEGSDNIVGTPGNDTIQAGSGNDMLKGEGGNDILVGGPGIDTAIYSNSLKNYSITGAASKYSINGPEGNDTLYWIERIVFTDKKIAIDLNDGQAANSTVRIIGAAFDAPTIQERPDYVGIGINLFDSGQSMLAVSQLVVDFMNLSNEDFVKTVFQNVVGKDPSATEHELYCGLLQGDGGTFNQAQLLEFAANCDANATNINLIGLQQSGVEFI